MDAKIYGHNHSPWVQAVLLGLHEKKIKYTLYQTPPFEILKIFDVSIHSNGLNLFPCPKIEYSIGFFNIPKFFVFKNFFKC